MIVFLWQLRAQRLVCVEKVLQWLHMQRLVCVLPSCARSGLCAFRWAGGDCLSLAVTHAAVARATAVSVCSSLAVVSVHCEGEVLQHAHAGEDTPTTH